MTLSIGLGMFIVAILFAFLCGVLLPVWFYLKVFRIALSKPEGLENFLKNFVEARMERIERGEHVCPVKCPCGGRGWV
jgi:hypothetical protein